MMNNTTKEESESLHRYLPFVRQKKNQNYNDAWMKVQHFQNAVCDIIQRVKLFQQREEYDKGAVLLAKAINQYPSAQRLRESLCELQIETEQYNSAIDTLKEIEKERWELHSFELMAIALEKSKRYDKLEKEMELVSSLKQHSATLSNIKGLIAYRKKNMSMAASYFRQAMNMDYNFGLAFVNLGLLKIEKGNAGAGWDLIREGFKKTPCEPTVLESYHSVISEFGDYRGNEQLFKQAVQENPECKKLNYLYADILLQQKKYSDAISVIEKAIATFGIKDGILKPARFVRERIGLFSKEPGINPKTISLCMIVKNEEKTLAKCLFSVKGLVDEIIVVDTGSSDQTKEIAKVFGAFVYDYGWNDNFADARNLSLSKANGAWIMILDADEQIAKTDHAKIKKMTAEKNLNQPVAYSFTTRNYVVDAGMQGWIENRSDYPEEKGTGWYPSEKVRLFPNLSRIRFEHTVHETVEESLKRENICILSADVPIHHYGDLDQAKKRRKKEIYYQLGQKKLSLKPNDLKGLVENAIQANEVEAYHKAIKLWEAVLVKAPTYAKAYFNVGYAYIQIGDYDRAKRASQKAAELDPNLKEALINLSLCELRTGDPQKAVQILNDVLVRYPNHPMAMGNLGVAHCLAGNKDKGLRCLRNVGSLGFDTRDFVQQHVRALETAGQVERALALGQSAFETVASGFMHRRCRVNRPQC